MSKPSDELSVEQIDKMLDVIANKSEESLNESYLWVNGRADHWRNIERLAREIKQRFERRIKLMDLTLASLKVEGRDAAKEYAIKGYDNLAETGRLLEELESKIYD